MKKMARATLCFMVMLAILLPTLARTSAAGEPHPASYQDGNLECDSNDVNCKADAFKQAWVNISHDNYLMKNNTSDYLAYLSELFNVQLRFDRNGYSVLKSIYPSFMKQIEQEVIRDTGVALPLSFNYNDGKIAEKGTLEIATLLTLIAICVAVNNMSLGLARWNNEVLYQGHIDRITGDLTARGWPPDLARTEANYQWEHYIKKFSVDPSIMRANKMREAMILASKDYYNAWASKNHALIQNIISLNVRERRFSPNPFGSGGMTGGLCRHAVYIPRSDTQSGANNVHDGGVNLTGTVTVTTAGGYWVCL